MKLLTENVITKKIISISNRLNRIKSIVKILTSPEMEKLIKIGNSIKTVETNEYNDLYIEFRSNVILNVPKSIIASAKDEVVLGYTKGSFSPNFNFMELVNTKDLNNSVIRIRKKIPAVEYMTRLNIVKWSTVLIKDSKW